MTFWISFAISCLALFISGLTAWLTFFRKGKLIMTQPTVIAFGSTENDGKKAYFRTLLYSTAKRGIVIESLYISLQRGESKQNFNIWGYGDHGNLMRGSGLFIPQEGVALDHHFWLPKDGTNFEFLAGNYKLTVIANLVGNDISQKLMDVNLSINESQAKELSNLDTGIYFDWGPDQQNYFSHIDTRPNEKLDEILGKLISSQSQEN